MYGDERDTYVYRERQKGIDHYALDVGSPAALEAAATALIHAGIPYRRPEGWLLAKR